MAEYRQLQEVLNLCLNAQPGAPQLDPAQVGLTLQTARDSLLKLLAFKGPNQASRQQVENLKVKLQDGQEVGIDDTDRRMALQLSATFNLDEVFCVELLLRAQDETGHCSTEMAAGIYLTMRQQTAQSFLRLLSEVATYITAPQGETRNSVYATCFQDFVTGLLSERTDGNPAGPQVLLMRLIEILNDTTLEVTPNSQLKEVLDVAGQPVSRALMLKIERRLIAKCLLYCLVIDQRAAPQVVSALLDLLSQHHTRGNRLGPAQDPYYTELGQLVLLSLVLALIPQEERGTQERDALMAVFNAVDVKNKIFPQGSRPPGTPLSATTTQPPAGASGSTPGPSSALPTPLPPVAPALMAPTAILRLCWAVLAASVTPSAPGTAALPQALDEAKKLMQEVAANRTLSRLRQFFSHPLLQTDTEEHKDTVACCVYRLLGQTLLSDYKLGNVLYVSMDKRVMQAVKRTGGGAMAFCPLPADAPSVKWDHLGSALALIATVLHASSRLWLRPDSTWGTSESHPAIEALVSRTVLHDAMRVSPELRIPFFQFMTSLASDELGVSAVLRQFVEISRLPTTEVLTWRKLMTTIVEYVVRYNVAVEEAARQTAASGTLSMIVRSQEERLMNSWEAGILVSSLGLLRAVIDNGAKPDVQGFLDNLAREIAPSLNGLELWDPLLQLMCHPVSNTVKAALDSVLTALAQKFPEPVARKLLEKLVACVPVNPGVTGVSRLDLVTQLNEVEARKEEYPETLAFINLLNHLLAAALLDNKSGSAPFVPGRGGSAAEDGTVFRDFTAFVVNHVLAHLAQRGYRRPSQKWEVAAVCLQHLEIMMEAAQRSGSRPQSTPQGQAPGWSVVQDILSTGATLQALLHVLGPGYSDLASTSLQYFTPGTAANGDLTSEGNPALDDLMLDESGVGTTGVGGYPADPLVARQAAVLSALRVVNKVFQLDEAFVATLGRTSNTGGRFSTLDVLLQSGGPGRGFTSLPLAVPGGFMGGGDSGTLVATLLQYVCYQDSVPIQVEALSLALTLSGRNPAIVDQLSSSGGADSPLLSYRRGVAVALRESLEDPSAVDSLTQAVTAGQSAVFLGVPPVPPSHMAASLPQGDLRAALILRLLLNNTPAPATPTVTHLLTGFDPEPGMSAIEESVLTPNTEYTCLTVIERYLLQQQCQLAGSKPELYAQMLHVLYLLALDPRSQAPTLHWLSAQQSNLLPALTTVLLRPLPTAGEHTWAECVSCLSQWGWILKLTALLLIRSTQPADIHPIIAGLLQPQEVGGPSMSQGIPGAAGMNLQPSQGMSGCVLLHLLSRLSRLRNPEPQIGDFPGDVRRLLADMSINNISIEDLLMQPHLRATFGLMTETDTGEAIFDEPVVWRLMQERAEQYLLRGGGQSPEVVKAAVTYAATHANTYNAFALVAYAQAAAAQGWLQVVNVLCTRQYAQLAALATESRAAQVIMEILTNTLKAAESTIKAGQTSATPGLISTLLRVVSILLGKLKELGTVHMSLGQDSDPLLSVRTPARCAEVLKGLLELLTYSRLMPDVRYTLYGALLKYMQFCGGSKMGSCTPVVLQALLQGQEGRGLLQTTRQREAGRATPAATTPRPNGRATFTPAAREVFALVPVSSSNGVSDDTPLTSDQVAGLVAQLDASQETIERTNASLINTKSVALVEALMGDAQDGTTNALHRAVALQLLSVLIHASRDSVGASRGGAEGEGPGLVQTLLHRMVPQNLIHTVASVQPNDLLAQTRKARRATAVLQGQLAVLLHLQQAGASAKARQLSAQALFGLQPIQALAMCRVLDLEPEDPGRGLVVAGSGDLGGDTLRQRLQQLMPAALRIVLGLTGSLPESTLVRQEAKLFVTAHTPAINRILMEAAGSGTRDWAPKEPELEQAELATSLLSRLVPIWSELGPLFGEQLRTALFRLAHAFLCLDGRSNSPIVKSLHIAGPPTANGGPAPAINRNLLIQRTNRVASLRSALTLFLRDLVTHSAPTPTSTTPGVPGTSCVPFRCRGSDLRPEVDPFTSGPTLWLVNEAAEQACLDSLSALEEIENLLRALRSTDSRLDDRTCVELLEDYGPVRAAGSVLGADAAAGQQGGNRVLAGGLHARRKLVRHYLALAASSLDRLLGKTLFVVESSLVVVVVHFLRYLPGALPDLSNGSGRPGSGLEEMLMAAAALGQQRSQDSRARSDVLGTPDELQLLATRLQATCVKAEQLLENASKLGTQDGSEGGDGEHWERLQGIDLMVRTIKSYLVRM